MQVGKLTPTDLGIAMMTLADAGILHIPLIRKLQKVGCALRGGRVGTSGFDPRQDTGFRVGVQLGPHGSGAGCVTAATCLR